MNGVVFEAIIDLVESDFPNGTKLSKFNMLVMFFLKIRLNLHDEDIAH